MCIPQPVPFSVLLSLVFHLKREDAEQYLGQLCVVNKQWSKSGQVPLTSWLYEIMGIIPDLPAYLYTYCKVQTESCVWKPLKILSVKPTKDNTCVYYYPLIKKKKSVKDVVWYTFGLNFSRVYCRSAPLPGKLQGIKLEVSMLCCSRTVRIITLDLWLSGTHCIRTQSNSKESGHCVSPAHTVPFVIISYTMECSTLYAPHVSMQFYKTAPYCIFTHVV